MRFAHRLIWSTAYVRQQLVERSLSEQATFTYFLAIIAFDWLQFPVISVTPRMRIEPWIAITRSHEFHAARRNRTFRGHRMIRSDWHCAMSSPNGQAPTRWQKCREPACVALHGMTRQRDPGVEPPHAQHFATSRASMRRS
jgi:MoaA/NifB/PqqE/SkfB family radical SAM enzyme